MSGQASNTGQLLTAIAAAVAACAATRVVLAVSGGLDSLLLLQLAPRALPAHRAEGRLRVLHVDHGLAEGRALWRSAVEGQARALGLACQTLTVSAPPPAGESVEAWLRRERYRLLARELTPGEALLLAQHRDDQAETFLLQALRAAGPAGLAAMPAQSRLGPGWLLRPWLDFPRLHLAAVAVAEGLAWHEDPSNADTRFDRNYLRRDVMPALRARWPSAARTLARAARWQVEASEALEAAAACLLPALVGRATCGLPTLHVPGLLGHSPALRRVLLRAWLAGCGAQAPGARHIEALEALLVAAADRSGAVCWGGMRVRRHREHLYFDPLPSLPSDPDRAEVSWLPPATIDLPAGRLWASLSLHGPQRLAVDTTPCVLAARRGGERIRPSGDRHTRNLKGLLQRAGIPPWRRAGLPLIYRAGELIAVPGLCVAASAAAAPGEPGWRLHWESGGDPVAGGPIAPACTPGDATGPGGPACPPGARGEITPSRDDDPDSRGAGTDSGPREDLCS